MSVIYIAVSIVLLPVIFVADGIFDMMYIICCVRLPSACYYCYYYFVIDVLLLVVAVVSVLPLIIRYWFLSMLLLCSLVCQSLLHYNITFCCICCC